MLCRLLLRRDITFDPSTPIASLTASGGGDVTTSFDQYGDQRGWRAMYMILAKAFFQVRLVEIMATMVPLER